MRQYFHNRREGVKERIGRAQSFDFTLEIQSPRTKLRKPPRSNFQRLSQLIHHGVIAMSLLSRLRAADEPQLKASIRIPYLQRWPGRLRVCDCTSINGCSLPTFACVCPVCVFVGQCACLTWSAGLHRAVLLHVTYRHIPNSISQTPPGDRGRQSQN